MNALKKIEYPTTKTDQSSLARRIITPLMNGEVDPIEFIVKVKGLASALQEVEKDKDVKEKVLSEVGKYGKTSSWNGATITLKEVGVKYDFSGCNDPEYNALSEEKKLLEKKIKERENFLRSLSEPVTTLNEETGEITKIVPAVRMATESYAISFQK